MASFPSCRKVAGQSARCAACWWPELAALLADEPFPDLHNPCRLCWLANQMPNVNSEQQETTVLTGIHEEWESANVFISLREGEKDYRYFSSKAMGHVCLLNGKKNNQVSS